MNISVAAIYEDGVFKPLGPIALREHQRVQVTIQATDAPQSADADPAVLERQQRAINEMMAEFRALPPPTAQDEFSGADHDEALYGPPR